MKSEPSLSCRGAVCRQTARPKLDRARQLRQLGPEGGIMTRNKFVCKVIVLAFVGLFHVLSAAKADNAARIELSSDRAFPESLTASSDGALYVGSPATGGITRIPPG